MIGVRGSGENPIGPNHPGGAHGLGVPLEAVYERLPKGTGVYGLPYEARAVPQLFIGSVAEAAKGQRSLKFGGPPPKTTEVGASELVDQFRLQVKVCDKKLKNKQRIVLGGYSQGSLVIRLALNQLESEPLILDHIKGIVLLGDPSRDLVAAPALSSDLLSRRMSVCLFGDLICKGPNDKAARKTASACIAESTFGCPHFQYGGKAALDAGTGRTAWKAADYLKSALQRPDIDWRNRTYNLTCDDTVKDPVKVALRDGKGTARGEAIGGYDRWDVRIQRITQGKLPSLGSVTAVLFFCTPQPSNFFTQELRVYRSSNGSEIARVPHLSGGEWLPPEYQPESVAIRKDRIVADLKFYGPGDPHGSPSRLRHLSWTWDGRQFVTHDAGGDSPALSRIELSRERVTVNGIGPVKLGMSPEEAAKAIGATIPVESRGPTCVDHTVDGGPTGLFLRFTQDRLVAVGVRPPATEIHTASGIHIGSTRDDVMETYAAEIEATTSVHGNEELVFAPAAPEFAGKVIAFGMVDGTVGLFIAGERDWATLTGPCGGD
ncbi:cutinase family protein [Streptomyces sp. NBC_00104]|uniref:cutinase family protein n=1 Tax=unclassified Streptomyces TaxID=2593676 RepID=UPI00324DBF79